MKYIVIEIQNGIVGDGNKWTIDDQNAAESKYYSVLAVAAISSVKTHAVALLNETGYCVMSKCYEHPEEVNE